MLPSLLGGIKDGFRFWRVALIWWAANLITAWCILGPLMAAIQNLTGDSIVADQYGLDNWHVLFELMENHASILSAILALALLAGAIYLILRLALTAGAIGLITGKTESFWDGAGRYFPAFFRMACFAIPLMLILFVIWIGILIVLTQIFLAIFSGTKGIFLGWISSLGVGLVILFFLRLVFDYGRIYLVASGSNSALYGLRKGLTFVVFNLFSSGVIGLIIILLGAVVLYSAYFFEASPASTVMTAFVIHQVALIVRAILGIGLFGAENRLLTARLGARLTRSPDDELTAAAAKSFEQQNPEPIEAKDHQDTSTADTSWSQQSTPASDGTTALLEKITLDDSLDDQDDDATTNDDAGPTGTQIYSLNESGSEPDETHIVQRESDDEGDKETRPYELLDEQPASQQEPGKNVQAEEGSASLPSRGLPQSDPLKLAGEGEKPPARRRQSSGSEPNPQTSSEHVTPAADPLNLAGEESDSLSGEADVILRREAMHITPDSDPLKLAGERYRRAVSRDKQEGGED